MLRVTSIAAMLLVHFGSVHMCVATLPGCECTGVNAGINHATHGSKFGTSCAAWEDGVTDPANVKGSCSNLGADEVGFWCCRAWCYVDAKTCDGTKTPFFSSFAQVGDGETLFYSFAACEGETKDVTYPTPEQCPFKGPAHYEPPVKVDVLVRDFTDKHPAFGCGNCGKLQEKNGGGSAGMKGMVEKTLDADGKPMLSLSQSKFTELDRASFKQWYSDDVCTLATKLQFDWDKDKDLHRFDVANNFLPLKDAGRPDGGKGLFTTELRVDFRYNGGEIFDFRGDDDVWVFINGRLAMDLGGCHGALPASVNLDASAGGLGISIGNNYELVLFQAERCFGRSNFKAEMSLRQDQGICPNRCNLALERGQCDIASGKCICYDGWKGADCAAVNAGGRNPFAPLRNASSVEAAPTKKSTCTATGPGMNDRIIAAGNAASVSNTAGPDNGAVHTADGSAGVAAAALAVVAAAWSA